MNTLTAIFTVATILIALLVTLVVWSRQGWKMKVGAFLLCLPLFPGLYFSGVEILGRPKPIGSEFLAGFAQEVDIYGFKIVPNEAIFVLVQIPGGQELRLYQLPWSNKKAEQLQEAGRQAAEGGAQGIKGKAAALFENSVSEEEPVFYPAPQPKMPDKQEGGGVQALEIMPGEDA